MFIMSNYVSLLLFLAFIVIVWILDGKNIKKEGPLFYLRRTQWGIDWIHRFGKKYSSFLKGFGSIGVIAAFGLLGLFYYFRTGDFDKKLSRGKTALLVGLYSVLALVFITIMNNLLFVSVVEHFNLGIYGSLFIYLMEFVTFVFGLSGYVLLTLVYGTLSMFIGQTTESSLQLVLPVEMPENSNLPVVSVPLFIWLISIMVILLVHELAHAVVSSAIGVEVKSIGYGFFALLPLGFAEPDEAKIEKAKSIDKSRVYSAGYFNNIVSAVVMVGVLLLVIGSVGLVGSVYGDIYNHKGVAYAGMDDVDNESVYPSDILPEIGVITSVGGVPVMNVSSFVVVMRDVGVGDEINIVVNETEYSLVTIANPDNSSLAYIGIYVQDYIVLKDEFRGSWVVSYLGIVNSVTELFMWVILLSVGIAFFNILPIRGLDGGKIMEEILMTFCGKKSGNRMGLLITKVTLLLIVFSLFGPYLMKLLSYLL